MGHFYETTLRVGAADAGLGFQCRPAGVLGLLQEAATEAAAQLHASAPEIYEKYGALWMVSKIWYRLERPLMWDEPVSIRTWHRGGKSGNVASYRDFDLLVEGIPVGEAVSAWVLVDAETRRLMKLTGLEEFRGTGGEELCKEKKLAALRLPTDLALVERRRFHYSDIDGNGHVNNVRYADLISDAAGLEEALPDGFVSSLQMCYLRECMVGESVDVFAGGGAAERFVHGVGADGKGRFAAHLTLDKV